MKRVKVNFFSKIWIYNAPYLPYMDFASLAIFTSNNSVLILFMTLPVVTFDFCRNILPFLPPMIREKGYKIPPELHKTQDT